MLRRLGDSAILPRVWLIAALFCAFILSFAAYVYGEREIDRANERRYLSHALADQLRQSSDDLTRMVRTYVVTGDPAYKQSFQDILDIRDGRRARPKNYQNIYWDLALRDHHFDRSEVGAGVSLLDLMRQAGFTDEEFDKLAIAKAKSDALTDREFQAMKLAETGGPNTRENRMQAIMMVHDDTYHQAKAAIMQPINEFYDMEELRTLDAVHRAQAVAIALRYTFIAFTVAVAVFLWRGYIELREFLGEKLFKQISDTSPLAIYMSVGIEQRAEYINPTFTKFFGYTLDEVPTADHWWPLAYPDQDYRDWVVKEWQRRVEHAIKTRTTIEPMEVIATCKDGSKKNISWGFVSIGEQNWAFGLDLTERREAEKALAEKAQQLEAVNAELEQFAYVASHDLRQPLRTVSSYLGLIEKSLQPESLTDDIKSFLGFAVNGAKRMDDLILGLLEYSRTGKTSELVAAPLSKVIHNAMVNLTVAIDENKAEIVVSDSLPTIKGDPTELTRLFQNLIGNAVKYHASGKHPKIGIDCRRQGGEWLISVRDNGIGIAPKDRDRAFAIFQRLVPQNEYEGTGIGLAVCKKIIDHHGGRIWVESEVDVGSTFFVALPTSEQYVTPAI